jgi:arylsulfatase A-like enzyme
MKNIILITIDTLRADMLGAYGGGDNLTPFTDSLQDNMVVFSSPYATGPYTQASFQGILASEYYLEYGKEKKLNKDKILISEPLKNAGVFTAGFHSNAYLSYFFGYNKGWEVFYDSMSDDVTDMYPFIRGSGINDKVKGFLDNFSFSKPLFLWVHYMDVHEPYIAEDSYLSKIDPSLKLSKDDMFKLFKEVILKRDISDKDTVDTLKKLYMAKVAETDDYLRKLFDTFESKGLLENSTIIITSDHGDEFSEHGGLSHDGKMYKELIHVPFLIYDKSYSNTTIDTPVSLIDIPPTICDMMEAKLPQSFKGKSLYPFDSVKPYTLYGEAMGKLGHKEKETDKPIHYMVEDNLKVIFKEDGNLWEAYDIEADPEDKIDISKSLTEAKKDKLNKFINRKNG